MYCKQDLKERGWTNRLIERFLGAPDLTATNPMYKCAAPMCLYDTERVKSIEMQVDFQAAFAQAAKRRERARQAAQTKRENTLARVEALTITVPQIPRAKLIRLACKSYNAWNLGNPYKEYASPESSDPAFLHRICVNFLRHEATSYDIHLYELWGKVGKFEARSVLKVKVLEVIEDEYPWLGDECRRQMNRRPASLQL